MDTLLREFRSGLRRLFREIGHTSVAVATIALGIGANAALFSVVDGSLLRPLPHPDPERLLVVSESNPERGWRLFGVSAPAFEDWSRQAQSLESIAAHTRASANLATQATPHRVEVLSATSGLLHVMGAQPLLGRDLTRDDEQRGREAVVLLGHALWQGDFGGRRDVVGSTLRLEGRPHEIVGVLPPGLGYPLETVQILRPLVLEGDTNRGAHWLQVLARTRPTSSSAQARAELAGLGQRTAQAHPETNAGWTVEAVGLQEMLVGAARPTLLLLVGAVVLVLLIACSNVAHLLLVRALGRRREGAIRVALGASRARLVREHVVESLVLCGLGALGGLAVAYWARAGLVWSLGTQLPAPATAGTDPRVLAFTAGLTLVTTLLVGLVPALRAVRAGAAASLHGTGRVSADAGSRRLSRGLVIGELAVATVLLVGAVLLLRSVDRLSRIDPGFDPRGGLVFRVAPPQTPPQPGQSEQQFLAQLVAERETIAGYYDALQERLEALPGVESMGAVNRLPLGGNWWTMDAWDAARSARPDEAAAVNGRVVTPGYFEAAGIALRAGRGFDARDTASSPLVAIVNETFARQVLRDAPLGHQIFLDRPTERLTIVGVVADVRLSRLAEAAHPTVYVPLRQALFGFYPDWGMDVLLRAAVPPRSLIDVVRREVASASGGLPVFNVSTLDDVVARSTGRQRAALTLLGSFATLAVLLAGIGLFGVVSHSVRLRTKEMGIRLALGSQASQVRALVMREAAVLGLAGTLLGLAGALAASRLLTGLLYGVAPADPLTYAGASLLLAAIVVAAAWRPAAVASRTDPAVVLQEG